MKTKTATTPPAGSSSTAAVATGVSPVPPAPVLDLKRAKLVEAYRHTKPACTVAFHQDAGDAGVHLFSATGNYIATVSKEDAAAKETKPAADAPTAS